MVERQDRNLEVRGSNPGPGSNFSLEFKLLPESQGAKDGASACWFHALVPGNRLTIIQTYSRVTILPAVTLIHT